MILLRYFIREVLLGTAAVTLVLLLVMLSTRFVKYLARAADGSLDTGVLFLLIFYRIPDFLQLILPLGLFVALLLVYGRMYLDNEMRVMFAAGISRFQLLMLTMAPVFIVTAIVAAISLWVSPGSLAKVEHIFHQQDARSEMDSLKAGQFLPFRNNQGFIYTEELTNELNDGSKTDAVDQAAAPKQMRNVYIFQQENIPGKRGQRSDVVVVADSGKHLIDERGRYLVLEQGYRLRDVPQEGRYEKIEFSRYGQRIESNKQTESPNLKIDALPTTELGKSDRTDYQAAWQWRISVVLLVPIVAIIALALGKADPRQGRYLKIFPAILLYLLYLILLNVVRDQLASGKLPLALGMWWIHVLFLLLGILLFNLETIVQRMRMLSSRSGTTS